MNLNRFMLRMWVTLIFDGYTNNALKDVLFNVWPVRGAYTPCAPGCPDNWIGEDSVIMVVMLLPTVMMEGIAKWNLSAVCFKSGMLTDIIRYLF